MNLWKDIKTRPSPKVVYVVVEIPKGSRNKYEYELERGVFVLEQVLYSPFKSPIEYGMIPQTIGDDGTPLDILVMMHQPTFPGCIIECRPIGVMKMTDEGERDDKILGVPVNDPGFTDINDIQDVPPPFLEEIAYFFREYKKFRRKNHRSSGLEKCRKGFGNHRTFNRTLQ